MPRVTFVHPQGLSGEVEPNTSILEASKILGFPLTHDCGGNASCTTCRVEVESGGENLSEIDFDEQDLLDRENLTEAFNRLGCQAKIRGDVVVRVPLQKFVGPVAEGTVMENSNSVQ
ncbi:MAG: 2Fe-2S iron-sulfur cluster-binding protein [Nitrospirales bacterium]|nr:2Fe-2S iron-sulfur cluster-binding protein [Nitrospirales bacterium]